MTPGFQISHVELSRVLRRAGYPVEEVKEILAQLPDPVDVDRDSQTLGRYGLTRGGLMDQMGASP